MSAGATAARSRQPLSSASSPRDSNGRTSTSRAPPTRPVRRRAVRAGRRRCSRTFCCSARLADTPRRKPRPQIAPRALLPTAAAADAAAPPRHITPAVARARRHRRRRASSRYNPRMEKVYAPQAIERRIYERWESHGWFAPSGQGAPYCIMIPPPNVTGTLHMGHAFQHTLMDALTRYERMRGRAALWQPGTDHAGIATQMVVERQLNAQGVKRTDLGREAFLERVWQWKEQSGGAISAQMRRLGDSVDWSRERFTMDPGLSRAVTEVFVRLHAEGLIYRGKRLVNWDPVLLTALSDLEVQAQEEDGQLWHIRYPLADGTGQLVVATTRPETILGDAAVAVHPEDPRYQELIGRQVRVPLAERL